MKRFVIMLAAVLTGVGAQAAPLERVTMPMAGIALPDSFHYHGTPAADWTSAPCFPSPRQRAPGASPDLGGDDAVVMLPATNTWQRLGDYRSQSRIRLLILWESGESIVSLQTGGHGDPYLQWNYAAMSPSAFKHGLLDRLMGDKL